jgi:hypothetical protein
MFERYTIMKLSEKRLAILEEFWAEEYESDYRRFIEKPAKVSTKTSFEREELVAMSSAV